MANRVIDADGHICEPTAVWDDPNRRCPDIAKAKALVGWEPTVPLDEGLRLALDL